MPCPGRDHTSEAAATGAAGQAAGRKPRHWGLLLDPKMEVVGVRVRPCWSALVGASEESAAAVDDVEFAAGAGAEMEAGAVAGSHSR